MIFGCLGSLFGLVIVTFPKRMYKELNGRNKNSEECINGSRILQKEDKDEDNPNDNSDECLGFEGKTHVNPKQTPFGALFDPGSLSASGMSGLS